MKYGFFKGIGLKLKKYLRKFNLTKRSFNAMELGLVIIMASVFGLLIGEVTFSSSGNCKISNSASEVEKVFDTLLNDYYGDVTEEQLEEAAINGMMDLLGDKYSTYLDDEDASDFNEQLNGTFVGIGAEVMNDTDGVPTVVSVFDDTPASKAGLVAGDKILKLDGEDVSNMLVADLVAKIKGTTRTIKMVVSRDGEEKELNFTTGQVEIPSVSKDIIEKDNHKIGYLTISIFALNTDEQFEKKLLELEEEGIDSLIIDVRDNSGGHLDTVVNIASLFINKGENICQIKTKDKTTKITSEKNNERNYPIAMLINGSSASASELLAGALSEMKAATLVGKTTYGKGTVQQTMELSNGSMIKYTAETWLTAKGNSIDGIGIKPTIEVDLSDEYYENPSTELDNQLQKAIEVLNK